MILSDVKELVLAYFKSGFKPEFDSWGIEEEIKDYIDLYYQ